MPTVVLIGFSTAGKSTVVRDLKDRWEGVRALDSDKEIARGFTAGGDPHVYAIYSQLGRERALEEIARRENAFLVGLDRSSEPLLVAAGPGIVIRREWSLFVERVKPTVVFISQSAAEAHEGLRRRREEHKASPVAYAPYFGCWDQGTTTQRVGDVWVEVDDATGLANVGREMRQLDELYRRYAHKTFDKASLRRDPAPALNFVASKLGLGPV